jgi:hypothetical protein
MEGATLSRAQKAERPQAGNTLKESTKRERDRFQTPTLCQLTQQVKQSEGVDIGSKGGIAIRLLKSN